MSRESQAVSPVAQEHIKLATAERYFRAGDLLQAEALCREAIALDPSNASAHHCLGAILYAEGHTEEALRLFEAALQRDPRHAPSFVCLSEACLELGRVKDAALFGSKATECAPRSAEAYVSLAEALALLGRVEAAFEGADAALQIAPHDAAAIQGAIALVQQHGIPDFLRGTEVEKRFEAAVLEAFHDGRSETTDLAKAAAEIIKIRYELGSAIEAPDPRVVDRLSEDELFLRLLQETINADPDIEAFGQKLRSVLAQAHAEAEELPHAVARVSAALALQGFHNEYVWPCSAKDESLLDRLEQDIETGLAVTQRHANHLRGKLLIFAMYRPLSKLKGVESLLDLAMGGEAQRVVALTVREVREIGASAERITTLAAPQEKTSLAVEAQYEQFPYPRWFHLVPPERMSFRAFLRRRFPDFKAPDFAKDPIDILIAGCGTGKHPIRTALRFRGSRVLAIDLSRASLAYADRMARKLGADNIEFAQADILALRGFERRFHLVEWGGALKHMEDPALGWDILRDLLVPEGFFRGGVFSERGRTDAIRGREEISKLKLAGDSAGIRAARDHLLNNADKAVREKLVDRSDFYAMSGCRELLFPICERSFGLGDAAALIEKSGMQFVGVVAERPLQTAYAQANPVDPSLTNLEALQRFEAAQPELFFGRCQVVCQKRA